MRLPSVLLRSLTAAAVALIVAVVAVHPTLAAPLGAESTGSADRTRVILITFAAIGAALLLCTIGYVYRRAIGNDRVPPVPLLEPGQKITGE